MKVGVINIVWTLATLIIAVDVLIAARRGRGRFLFFCALAAGALHLVFLADIALRLLIPEWSSRFVLVERNAVAALAAAAATAFVIFYEMNHRGYK